MCDCDIKDANSYCRNWLSLKCDGMLSVCDCPPAHASLQSRRAVPLIRRVTGYLINVGATSTAIAYRKHQLRRRIPRRRRVVCRFAIFAVGARNTLTANSPRLFSLHGARPAILCTTELYVARHSPGLRDA